MKIPITLQLVLLGIGLEYEEKEVDKISNISCEATELIVVDTEPNSEKRSFNWAEMYGELGKRRI